MGKGGRIQAAGGRPVPTRIREHSKIITRARGWPRSALLRHDESTFPAVRVREFLVPFVGFAVSFWLEIIAGRGHRQ